MDYFPVDLIIVGKNFWIERTQDDEGAWWAFRAIPTEPALTKELDFSGIYKMIEMDKQMTEETRKEQTEMEKQRIRVDYFLSMNCLLWMMTNW